MSGRTDAGVHGWGQVLSGDLPGDTDLDDLARRINKLCAPEISIRESAWAAADFDARFSELIFVAVGKAVATDLVVKEVDPDALLGLGDQM